MRVALIGSVDSSVQALRGLIDSGVDVTAVLGVAPEAAKRISDYRDLSQTAEPAGIPYMAFGKVSEPAVEAFLREHPADALWVIGLSQLVPDSLLAMFPEGGVGFHPTLLPEGRGRAPIAWTIIKGARAAVSLFRLVEEPDAGDLLAQREVPVLPDDYAEDLIERVAGALYEVVRELGPAIRSGGLTATPQDHSRATVYPRRTPRDGRVDWNASTDAIYRLVRGAGVPYPGAFTTAGALRLTIVRGRPVTATESEPVSPPTVPGTVLRNDPRGIVVATGDGQLLVTECEERRVGVEARSRVRVGEVLGAAPCSRVTGLRAPAGRQQETPMDTFDAIYQRRAMKGFDPDHRLTKDEETKLLEAAIQAPTSFNIQHWRFVILRDPALRKRIRTEFGNDQAQMTDASLLVLMTADVKAWAKDPARYWQKAPQEVADLLVGWMGPFHEGRDWLQRDEAQRSIGMAMQTLMLAAKAMGYDSCPMIGFEIDEVAKLIDLPDDHVMGPMVAIGKGTKEPWPKPGQLTLDEVVVENGF